MAEAVTWMGLAGYGWLLVFQILLACGAPLGALAWGGAQRVLSPSRRWASLAATLPPLLGLWAMARALGVLPGPEPAVLLWVLCILFAGSAVLNALSSSAVERAHGVPLTLLLSISSGLTAAT
ncbi:MAG: hypothetical protein AAGB05_13715 [Pseudomonadota bacterium]